jgi:malonate transporter and related proteins
MLNTIATTLVPVAFVILLGYLSGRRNVFGVDERTMMTKLVLSWLLPPLLLAGILKTPRADLTDYKIPLIFLVGLMVPYLVALLVYRYGSHADQRTVALKASLLSFPDMVFMGIPILHRVFGPTSIYPILIANLVPTILILPITSVLLELGSKKRTSFGKHVFLNTLIKALKEPRVWLPFVGAALVVLNVRVPLVVIGSLDLIGNATTGLSLFVVGLIIAEEKVQFTGAVTVDILLKNLVHPAVMVVTVLAFGVTGALAKEAVLLAAIPSAVITTMFAEQYRVMQSESSTAVLGTRIVSFATIPLVLALTQHL